VLTLYAGMKKLACIALALVLAGCSKAPDRLESPSMIISAVLRDGKPVYTLAVTGALLNKTSDTVYLDYRATLVFGEAGKDAKRTPATAIPISVDAVYPFASSPVRLAVTGGDGEFAPLFALFDIPAGEVVKSGSTEDIFINDELIRLEDVSYRAATINSVLREKQNEKNK
jgi:hypothetical protein